MRYVHDEAADQTVLKHEKLQAVIRGRAVMLWLPGTMTGLAVQGALLLGAAGPIMVVRGAPSGRTRVYRLSLCQLGVGVCVALVSFARWHTASLVVSVGGALMSFIASRLVAGPDYALWSAIYRSQRLYLDEQKGLRR